MKILKVLQVDTTWLKSNPPVLVIDALGAVGSSGWTNGRLEPWYYIDFPEDGIQDFDFVADPPTGMALQVVSPITAKLDWPSPPKSLKGVRIHARLNKKKHKFGKGKQRKVKIA